MLDEHVEFFKAAFIEKHGNAFAGRVLAFLVLRLDAFFTAAKFGLGPALHQFLDIFLLYGHMNVLLDI